MFITCLLTDQKKVDDQTRLNFIIEHNDSKIIKKCIN